MCEERREELSALVDGEVDPDEASRLLDQVTSDPALAGAWERYHLIGDVLRSTLSEVPAEDLAQHVRKLVDSEPASLTERRRGMAPAKAVTGFALAASVTLVAVVGIQLASRETSSVADQTAQVTEPAGQGLELAGARWNVQHPAVEARLNRYLVDHSEYLNKGMWGVLPYARIVTYDDGK